MIRILVADQRYFMGDSIRALIEKQADMCYVGSVSTVEELHCLLPECDVALIYPNFVKRNIIVLLNDLHQVFPEVKLIPLELPDKPQTIVKYVEAGSVGYLLKKEGLEDVLDKIRAAADGRALISDTVAAVMMNHIWSLANSSPLISNGRQKKVAALTRRQQEVMELVCEGLTNQEIANQLVIEQGTVKNHIHNILKKVEVSNRQEAAILYQQFYRQENGTHRHEK